ncbi:sodium-coupled monocarboxylate transporter 1-like [Cherax quadricarinatus]|uniref:sodium-coupled monocarboxylate transporter 1-like n=1 Tax=Cherax quadricarinatus TaxID=27406 RepID=UPI00387EB7D1
MEKLGGVLEVGTMFSGIICGPLCGIFLAGILTPWVNAKGAMVGGLTAFVLSAWVVVGSFVHGSAPRYLSLSTSGCPVNLTSVDNITVIFFSNSSATDSYMYKTVTRDYQQINSTLSDLPTPTTVQGWSVKDIYELSYCYIGVSAIFITLIVSNIVSFCTGALSPSCLVPGTVSPSCGRLHRWLWSIFNNSHAHRNNVAHKEESEHQQDKP